VELREQEQERKTQLSNKELILLFLAPQSKSLLLSATSIICNHPSQSCIALHLPNKAASDFWFKPHPTVLGAFDPATTEDGREH
jgi:hypothetical protein